MSLSDKTEGGKTSVRAQTGKLETVANFECAAHFISNIINIQMLE